jgi:hypothetical protein
MQVEQPPGEGRPTCEVTAYANLYGSGFEFHKKHKYSVSPVLFLIIAITGRCQFEKCTPP